MARGMTALCTELRGAGYPEAAEKIERQFEHILSMEYALSIIAGYRNDEDLSYTNKQLAQKTLEAKAYKDGNNV